MSAKKIAEIWVGNMGAPAYRIEVKSIEWVGENSAMVTAEDGTVFDVSQNNLVVIKFPDHPTEKGGAEK